MNTIDEDLLSRLKYTRSRLEDSEISTDAVEQIDEELEATEASLNKQLQVSINSDRGSGFDLDQRTLSEEMLQPIIPPKPKQNFRDLLRHQINSIQKDSEIANVNDVNAKGRVPPPLDHNNNFATVNRAYFRLTKFSPPKILAQPVNIVPPIPSILYIQMIPNKN